jgi:hypothetical protein
MSLHRQAPPPDFCVRCNAPAGGSRMSVHWRPRNQAFDVLSGLIFLFFIFGVVGGALGGLIAGSIVEALSYVSRARDPNLVRISLGLCHSHLRRKQILPWIVGALLAGCVVQLVIARLSPGWTLLILPGIACLVAAIALSFLETTVKVLACDQSHVWIKGVSPQLLNRLPPLPH